MKSIIALTLAIAFSYVVAATCYGHSSGACRDHVNDTDTVVSGGANCDIDSDSTNDDLVYYRLNVLTSGTGITASSISSCKVKYVCNRDGNPVSEDISFSFPSSCGAPAFNPSHSIHYKQTGTCQGSSGGS